MRTNLELIKSDTGLNCRVARRWKWIKGYEGLYQVSDDGWLRRVMHECITKNGMTVILKEKILQPTKDKPTGILTIDLSKNGISKGYTVSHIIAEAFVPNPNNKPQVTYIDGDRENLDFSNLAWIDLFVPISPKGEMHKNHKLTEIQVREIKYSKLTSMQLAKIYNVSRGLIYHIKNNRIWKHVN